MKLIDKIRIFFFGTTLEDIHPWPIDRSTKIGIIRELKFVAQQMHGRMAYPDQKLLRMSKKRLETMLDNAIETWQMNAASDAVIRSFS